ncbi:hypothetical protein DPMN_061042 [Dreissena polymorpha]|uniref:Uncharacterized protein n=1 Tax=Dreissena polymorpha TaxID=45954 RepID=A0A9D4C6A7_DREPO|nr:hypothetical protein DPMN_061042 [Dreissena polymorpha]
MKISKEVVDSMQLERVHRSPGHPTPGKTRSIVAKFSFFKESEAARRQWKQLKGTKLTFSNSPHRKW